MPYIPVAVVQGAGLGNSEFAILQEIVAGVGGIASLDFSAIPQTYRNLRLEVSGAGEAVSNSVAVNMQFNGDTGSNYAYTNTSGAGSGSATSISCGSMVAASIADAMSWIVVDVFNYQSTTWKTLCRVEYGFIAYGVTSDWNVVKGGYLVKDNIDRIVLTPTSGDFAEGTVGTLFGKNLL